MGQAQSVLALPRLDTELGPGQIADLPLCCCTTSPEYPCCPGCLSPTLLRLSKLWPCHCDLLISVLSTWPDFYLLQNQVKATSLQKSAHMYNLKTIPEASQNPWMGPCRCCQSDRLFACAAGNPDSRRLSHRILKAPL